MTPNRCDTCISEPTYRQRGARGVTKLLVRIMLFGRLLPLVVSALPFIGSALGFGLVESGNNFVVTTDGGLVFTGEF